MLCQCAEVSILARLAGRIRTLRDRLLTPAVVARERELVEKVADGAIEIFALANPGCRSRD